MIHIYPLINDFICKKLQNQKKRKIILDQKYVKLLYV